MRCLSSVEISTMAAPFSVKIAAMSKNPKARFRVKAATVKSAQPITAAAIVKAADTAIILKINGKPLTAATEAADKRTALVEEMKPAIRVEGGTTRVAKSPAS